MKQHGIGVGYKFPHDFEGDDVEQQYLPDELVGRRYYVPNDQGHEVTIAARMAARAEAAAGKPRKKSRPTRRWPAMSRRPAGRARRTARSSPRPRRRTRAAESETGPTVMVEPVRA